MQNAEAQRSRVSITHPTHHACSDSQLSTLNPQLPPLAAAAGLRVGAAAGDDQQDVPGRGGDSVSLGAAAGALPVELHHLLRQPALVYAASRSPWRSSPPWAACAGRCSRQRPMLIDSVYSGGLFVCCMVCHGELYRLKPDPRHLTGYYLMIAAGGALGGLFVAVVAPLIFTRLLRTALGPVALRPVVPGRLPQKRVCTLVGSSSSPSARRRSRSALAPRQVALAGVRFVGGGLGGARRRAVGAGAQVRQREGLPGAELLRRADGVQA